MKCFEFYNINKIPDANYISHLKNISFKVKQTYGNFGNNIPGFKKKEIFNNRCVNVKGKFLRKKF